MFSSSTSEEKDNIKYLGTSLPFSNHMALSKQRNGTVGSFHMMLKVLPSNMLKSSTGMVSKKYKD